MVKGWVWGVLSLCARVLCMGLETCPFELPGREGKTFSREKKNHPSSFQNIRDVLFLTMQRGIWDKGEMQTEQKERERDRERKGP